MVNSSSCHLDINFFFILRNCCIETHSCCCCCHDFLSWLLTVWLSVDVSTIGNFSVCRTPSALCVSWWTCLNMMLLLANRVTKKRQPTLFQWAWKTHIKVVREEGEKTRVMRKTGDREEIKKKVLKKKKRLVLWQVTEDRKLDNANPNRAGG